MKNIYFVLILCVFASCSDSNRTIYGCLDPLATNYSPNTDIDDGSCIYEADIVFYLDANAAVYLGSQTNQINFFIDESFVGYDSYPFTFSLSAPDCYQPGFVSATIQWYESSITSINWQLTDQSDNVFYDYDQIIDAGSCNQVLLTYSSLINYAKEN